VHGVVFGEFLFVVKTAAAEADFVGGEDLLVGSLVWDSYAVIFSLDGDEIADCDDFSAFVVDSSERYYALEVVVVANPGETVP